MRQTLHWSSTQTFGGSDTQGLRQLHQFVEHDTFLLVGWGRDSERWLLIVVLRIA